VFALGLRFGGDRQRRSKNEAMSTGFLPSATPSYDAAILARVIDPQKTGLPAEVAHSMLQWEFNSEDRHKMAELAEKARSGELSDCEQSEIDGFIRVGNLLSLVHAQAKLALQRQGKS
jgi:hypothetical protein